MKGFKATGRGPKSGHSFSSKAGFSGSTGRTQSVKGYTRSVPKRKFADGGMVVVRGTDGGSALTRRTKPVTGFDAEAGGKGPLRPGFNKGGKACYAEGGKVATTGAAIKMMKELMKRGNSAEDAAAKAARRYGVSKSEVAPKATPAGGGGLPADKQMLARGGMARTIGRAAAASGLGTNQPAQTAMAPRGRIAGAVQRAAVGVNKQPGFSPSPQGQKAPGRMAHHGYGSFGRRPVVG